MKCENCAEEVEEETSHFISRERGWICATPNWKERALKAEKELTAAYDEIFWTVPEAKPLVDKIITLKEMEADAILRSGAFEDKLKEAMAEVARLRQFEYSSFQRVAEEVMTRLEKSGYGKKGEANTFWAMVHAACDEVDGLREKVKELEQEASPKLKPVDPSMGDHMTWKDFLQYVDGGDLTDDDGMADLATATHVSDITIECSDVRVLQRPEWATHVVWYNK